MYNYIKATFYNNNKINGINIYNIIINYYLILTIIFIFFIYIN